LNVGFFLEVFILVMAKEKFVCGHCRAPYLKWQGLCNSCRLFDTIVAAETRVGPDVSVSDIGQVCSIKDVNVNSYSRLVTGINELDTVLGGGLLKDSVIFLAGTPGVGKSTFLLEIMNKISVLIKALYITTEESMSQIKLRFNRLGNAALSNWDLYQETKFESIIACIEMHRPELLVIDSLQNIILDNQFTGCHIQQLKHILHTLVEHAKKNHYILIITGHVTKDGIIAGPKVLEHLVDVVLYLEVLEDSPLRILRSTKNRFGSINEVGFFQIAENGFLEFDNPQEMFIENMSPAIGSALTWIEEGSRPFLIEIQTLLNKTRSSNPCRITHGIDNKQYVLLCAVVEKYLKIPLYEYDIFTKITHNYSIKTAHADLAIIIALLSSYYNYKFEKKLLYHGEVCLSGKVNAKYGISKKLPLDRYGFNGIIQPSCCHNVCESIPVYKLDSIYQVLNLFKDASH
jgi:DNA repair protein RadA/Sms